MNDGIRIYLGKELEEKVREKAAAEHISPGAYIASMLPAAIEKHKAKREAEEITFNEDAASTSECHIHLKGNDALMLKMRAAEAGLSPTVYVRRIAYTKEYVEIEMPSDGFDEFSERFSRLESSFTAAVGFILRGEGTGFRQDVELLKDYMGQICDLCKEYYKLTFINRETVMRRMMKEIRHQIRQNRD